MKEKASLLVYTAFVVAIGILLYFYNGEVAKKSIQEQILNNEHVVAKNGSSSMQEFLDSYANSLSLLSKNRDLKNTNVEEFLKIWENTPVEGISKIDKDGELVFNVNKYGSAMAQSNVSDRNFFKWAKGIEGNFYIGNPIKSRYGNTKGRYVIPVAVRILDKNDKFNGVLVSAVSIEEIISRYSKPLMLSPTAKIYLIDSDGNFVFSHDTSLNSQNYKNVFQTDFGDMDTGKMVLNGQLLAYTSFKVHSNNAWIFVMGMPESVVNDYLGPLYKNQFLVLLTFVIIILGFGILTIRKIHNAKK